MRKKPTLAFARLRVGRAQEYLRELKTEIAQFQRARGNPFPDSPNNREPVVAECDEFGNPVRWTVRNDLTALWAVMPAQWNVVAGEILYNLRTVLEYVVHELGWLDSNDRPSALSFQSKTSGNASRTGETPGSVVSTTDM